MTFFTLICCKICIFCLKRPKINENKAGVGTFLNPHPLIRSLRNRLKLNRPFSISSKLLIYETSLAHLFPLDIKLDFLSPFCTLMCSLYHTKTSIIFGQDPIFSPEYFFSIMPDSLICNLLMIQWPILQSL